MTSNKNQGPLRVGVIGCGHWGKNYVRMFSSLSNVVLAGVADVASEKRALAKKMAPGVAVFADYHELLNPDRCDALVISTVASTHYAIAREALNAGMHLLVEKPFTLTVQEAEDLIQISKKKQKILMVAHTFLYNPSVHKVKQCIEEGVMGDLYYLKARRTHLGLIREDVNAIWDLAPHDISMFLYFLEEEPVRVQAMGRCVLRKGREDAAFVSLEFPSGVIANTFVSWADSNKERSLDIVGSKARVLFDDLSTLEPVRIFYKGVSVDDSSAGFGEFKYMLRDGAILSPKVEIQEPLKVLCEEFVECVLKGRKPFSDAAMGKKVVSVLCQIDAALGRKGIR
jgi:predicted dehydrogenase